MKHLEKFFFLFLTGGVIYWMIEIFWRGYSHWSMFLLGGLCFVLCGLINEVLSWQTPLPLQMLIAGALITLLEFTTGCFVNLKMGWDVWDYSKLPFQFLGQISLRSSVVWYFLSAVGIILDDFLRYRLFGEEKPCYHFWGKHYFPCKQGKKAVK